MKFEVHCAPWVKVMFPGLIAAESAGAQALAELAETASTAIAANAASSAALKRVFTVPLSPRVFGLPHPGVYPIARPHASLD
jgi:hypothetical protein